MRLCVAPVILTGQFEDQLADLLLRPRAALLHGLLPARLLRVTNPAPQGVGMHNRHQLAQRLSQLRSELHQPVLFLRRHRHPLGKFAAEDFVLDLQVTDVPGQLQLRRAGDQQQQTLVEVLHRGITWKALSAREMASFLHPAMGRGKAGFRPRLRSAVKTPRSCRSYRAGTRCPNG